jgi:pimeloyl-ACP methyl ester carboxylesterase
MVTYPTSGAHAYSDLLPVIEKAIADSTEFYVLGWSFSGPLALALAAKYPTQIRGVILCAAFVRPPLPALSWLRFATGAPLVYLLRIARRAPLFLRAARRILLGATRKQHGIESPAVFWPSARGLFSRSMRGTLCVPVLVPCFIWLDRGTGWFPAGTPARCSESYRVRRSSRSTEVTWLYTQIPTLAPTPSLRS